MSDSKKPLKTISNNVRKLLKSNNMSIKRAASYINCTEQSFRNKLSRDSFSIKDLIILCYVCNAKLIIDYCIHSDDFDMDFFELSEYLNNEEFERIKKLEQQYTTEDLISWIMSLTKKYSKEELENMSNKDLAALVQKQFNGKIAIIDSEDEQ